MKQLVAMVCIVSLFIPCFVFAGQTDPASLAGMLGEESIDRDELHAVMADLLGAKGLTRLPELKRTSQADILTYLCYYIAFTAIIDFIDCLVYYDITYDCRSAIINGLLFYYFC